jgi:hypothetical protein
MDGIFPALLQEGRRIVVPSLVRIFLACLATGCDPAIWRQVTVAFIPKTVRSSYSGPRDFRLTSLTSFLLKTMESLVDRFLRHEALASVPLHQNQHAYQAEKSVGTVLHQLAFRVEKVLTSRRQLWVFIEGALNNTY